MGSPKVRRRAEALVDFIETLRVPLTNERAAQTALADALNAAPEEREVWLAEKDRIDFLLEHGLGIEMKLRRRWSKPGVLRQLKRYAEHPDVKALILVTGMSTGMPATLNGKPVYVASLSRGWM